MQPSTNTAMSVLTLIQINPISCCFLETQFKLNYFKERTCDKEKQFFYSSINLFSPLSQEFCNQLLSDKKNRKKCQICSPGVHLIQVTTICRKRQSCFHSQQRVCAQKQRDSSLIRAFRSHISELCSW